MAPTFTSLLFFKLNLKPRSKTLRPPSPALLRTNDPPTEQDISRIRDAIARVESKLKKKRNRTSQESYTLFLEGGQQKLSDCIYTLSTDFNYIREHVPFISHYALNSPTNAMKLATKDGEVVSRCKIIVRTELVRSRRKSSARRRARAALDWPSTRRSSEEAKRMTHSR